MAYNKDISVLYRHFDRIERIAKKFEDDLIASGRFKYVRTENNRKIYVELATGHEVPVLLPRLN
jgi:hypothetical protein